MEVESDLSSHGLRCVARSHVGLSPIIYATTPTYMARRRSLGGIGEASHHEKKGRGKQREPRGKRAIVARILREGQQVVIQMVSGGAKNGDRGWGIDP